MTKTTDTRRRCFACFRMKEIPEPLPVCRTCIGLVPYKLQSEFASAVITCNPKAQIAAAGAIVTTAWDVLQKEAREAPKEISVGAR